MNRILLIEDDGATRLLYRNRLTDLGYSVVVASTGAMGLMEARSASFDLFLVDIGLGSGIDGYEVCRRLKAAPEMHGVPVVLISGHVKAQEDLHRGYEAGCQSFLVKGDLMLLEDVVRAMLRIKSLQDELALQNRMLEDRNRRFEAEKAHGTGLEPAHADGVACGVPQVYRADGVLLVDGEGVVRVGDRGARDLFGQAIDGKHLALLAPDSRLEAIVRNLRTEPHESIRFELPERTGRSPRALLASIHPFVPQPDSAGPALRVVLLFDATRQRPGEGAGAEEAASLRREHGPLLEAAREIFRPTALLGTSAAVRELRVRLARVAQAEGPVLVQGPSGSGKGFVARILHFSGARQGPFVTVACGVSAALELELFGAARRPGAFHLAQGGTLFLQDVERLGGPLQERLLEALVKGRVLRQDAFTPERVDARIVAATRIDLGRAVELGQFQRELARRLTAETIVLPGLRERPEDIEELARHFLARHARRDGARLTPEAARALARHDWPDNVRELERIVSAACEIAVDREIRLADLPAPLGDDRRDAGRAEPSAPLPGKAVAPGLEHEFRTLLASTDATTSLLDSYERIALLHALRLSQGDKLSAARLLKIGKSTFYRRLKLHGIR